MFLHIYFTVLTKLKCLAASNESIKNLRYKKPPTNHYCHSLEKKTKPSSTLNQRDISSHPLPISNLPFRQQCLEMQMSEPKQANTHPKGDDTCPKGENSQRCFCAFPEFSAQEQPQCRQLISIVSLLQVKHLDSPGYNIMLGQVVGDKTMEYKHLCGNYWKAHLGT